jgi:hypothetical protein
MIQRVQMAQPSNVNRVSAGTLTTREAQRRPRDGAWIGISNGLDGCAKRQRIGGIVDRGTTRLALDARSTLVRGNRAVGPAPPPV